MINSRVGHNMLVQHYFQWGRKKDIVEKINSSGQETNEN